MPISMLVSVFAAGFVLGILFSFGAMYGAMIGYPYDVTPPPEHKPEPSFLAAQEAARQHMQGNKP